MALLGLLLIVLGGAAILTAVFSADVNGNQVQLLGTFDMSPLTLFLVGLVAGLLVLFGLMFLRWGMRRERAKRKEQKRLGKLATEVEQVERKRGTDADIRDAERNDRRTL